MKSFCFWLIFAFVFISVKGWCTSADNKVEIKNSRSRNNNLAKTEDYFVINLTTEQQYNFALSGSPEITFEGGNMIVTTVSNSINIPIQSVTFGKFLKVKPVVITANSYSREYGDANPVFEYTSEGETLDGEPEITWEASGTSPVGAYDIEVKQGTVKNLNVNYVDGTLTVTKAPLTAKAGEYTIKQGEALPEFAASYEGWKNDETEAVLSKLPELTTTATSESEPGSYEVLISGAEAQNYDISYINGILIIEEELSGINQIMNDKNDNVTIYTIDGRRVDKPKNGLYVVRMKDGSIHKVGIRK